MRKSEKGRTQLRELVIEWSERLKVQPRVIRVQQMRRKWGWSQPGPALPV